MNARWASGPSFFAGAICLSFGEWGRLIGNLFGRYSDAPGKGKIKRDGRKSRRGSPEDSRPGSRRRRRRGRPSRNGRGERGGVERGGEGRGLRGGLAGTVEGMRRRARFLDAGRAFHPG